MVVIVGVVDVEEEEVPKAVEARDWLRLREDDDGADLLSGLEERSDLEGLPYRIISTYTYPP